MTTLRVIVCHSPLRGSRDANPSGDRPEQLLQQTNHARFRVLDSMYMQCHFRNAINLLSKATAPFHTVNTGLSDLDLAQIG